MTRLWDPYAVENINNPYLMYDRMREQAPVYRAQTGEWIITRFDDAFHILGSDHFIVGNRLKWMQQQLGYLKDNRVDFQAIVEAMQSFLVLLNPPEHTRIRTMLSKAWNDHKVESIIKANIDTLLSQVKNEVDLIDDFAIPLPVMTICKIMGIEDEDYKRLKGLSAEMVSSLNLYTSLKDLVIISKAASSYVQYFKEYIHFRKHNPGDDLVSRIIAANLHVEHPLTDAELVSSCIFLFIAGEETTVNLIGNGMLALFANPDALAELSAHPGLGNDAINEFLRYDAPVQLVGRIADSDQEVGGNLISKGQTVTIAIGAANRDPEKYDLPHQLSFHRSFDQHLALGRGKHFCLGGWLAKVQGKLAIESLLKEFPDIKMKPQKLEWNNHLAIRGLKSLKVSIR